MKRVLIFGILTLIWCGVIFMFSAQDGTKSTETSSKVVEKVSEIVVEDYKTMTPAEQQDVISRMTNVVRKSAHFFEFAILGIFLFQFYSFAMNMLYRFSLAQFTAMLYACSDELHQYYVSGRGCYFSDVLIDSSGALLTITISALISSLAASVAVIRKSKKSKKKKAPKRSSTA